MSRSGFTKHSGDMFSITAGLYAFSDTHPNNINEFYKDLKSLNLTLDGDLIGKVGYHTVNIGKNHTEVVLHLELTELVELFTINDINLSFTTIVNDDNDITDLVVTL